VRLVTLVSLVACHRPDGPEPRYDVDGDDLFDAPWPSDDRRDADGTLAMGGFPNPTDSSFLQQYIDLAETLDGFGVATPIFLQFDAALSEADLPTSAETLDLRSKLALFAVAPGLPWDGERIPLQWHLNRDETSFEPENLLTVAPVWGFPLRERTRYALVVSTELARPAPAFQERLGTDPALDDLIDALPAQGYGPEDVAVATVFTTQAPTDELDRIATFLADRVAPPALDQELRFVEDRGAFDVFDGHVVVPLFQHGRRPYATTGGGFQFREDGLPIVAEWESIPLVVTAPRQRATTPPTGWPVVLVQHGTFGDAYSFTYGGISAEASQIAGAGYVGIGIDQPLHGARMTPDTNQSLHTFNYLNPESGRSTFRQGAIDAIWLAQLLGGAPTTFTLPDGERLPLDPERVYFLGHSQGGLTGAIAMPWMGGSIDGAVLSGAGAGLAITVVERETPIDIAATVESLLQFDDDEHVHELHPVLALVELLVEVTDPLAYGPHWYDRGDGASRARGAPSALVFSGLGDEETPARTAEALAISARIPQLDPAYPQSEGHALLGLAPSPGPLSGNVDTAKGPVTAGFSQWPDGDHFVIYDIGDARRSYEAFLDSGRDGLPTIPAR
jgi:hypothetical protein